VDEDDGFLTAVVGDGIPLLIASAAALIFAGGFALFLSATGEFLPHDIHYLGMSAADLCRIEHCRLVGFMLHDRAAFGGAIFGLGVMYVWLVVFPLRRGEAWSWWALAVSGAFGFATFLSYITYGYLDSWHAVGTLLLLPVFVAGLYRSKKLVPRANSLSSLLKPSFSLRLNSRRDIGLLVLLAGATGILVGGLAIFSVGITNVFVPSDLEFMSRTAEELRSISPRLVPLMAHDRVSFGGAVMTLGLVTLLCIWKSGMPRSLWEAIAIAGTVSAGAALGTHFFVGYTDFWHLFPAVLAPVSLVLGLTLTRTRQPPV
jgi:hypothetical protein